MFQAIRGTECNPVYFNFSGKLVGLSKTEYTVSEDMEVVAVCASRLGNTSCLENSFSLNFRFEADTAGIVHSIVLQV